MTQVFSVNNLKENNLNAQNNTDESKKGEIVDALIKQGLPRVFNPNNFINRISENYDISVDEARECLKEAVSKLEFISQNKEIKTTEKNDEAYGKSGYFYPDKRTNTANKKDEMDSLVSFGSFQRLKFGL